MLPAPTTTSPAQQQALDGHLRRRQAACSTCGVSAGSKGSAPRRASSPAAGACVDGRATTPPRRSGAGRSGAAGPAVVPRSKWACGPGSAGGVVQAPASPTCPGAPAARRRRRPAAHGVALQRQPQVLAAPRHLAQRASRPALRARSPAASAAACPAHRVTRAPLQPRGNAAPRDFHLGQLGHGPLCENEVQSPGDLMTVSSLRRLAACPWVAGATLVLLCHAACAQPAAPACRHRGRAGQAAGASIRRSMRRCSTSC